MNKWVNKKIPIFFFLFCSFSLSCSAFFSFPQSWINFLFNWPGIIKKQVWLWKGMMFPFSLSLGKKTSYEGNISWAIKEIWKSLHLWPCAGENPKHLQNRHHLFLIFPIHVGVRSAWQVLGHQLVKERTAEEMLLSHEKQRRGDFSPC